MHRPHRQSSRVAAWGKAAKRGQSSELRSSTPQRNSHSRERRSVQIARDSEELTHHLHTVYQKLKQTPQQPPVASATASKDVQTDARWFQTFDTSLASRGSKPLHLRKRLSPPVHSRMNFAFRDEQFYEKLNKFYSRRSSPIEPSSALVQPSEDLEVPGSPTLNPASRSVRPTRKELVEILKKQPFLF